MRDVTRQQGVTADNVFVEPMAKVEGMLTPVTDMNAVRLKVPVMLGTGLALPPRAVASFLVVSLRKVAQKESCTAQEAIGGAPSYVSC